MKKKPYMILLGSTIFLTLLAILTALPMHASKPNLLGYYSHCSFTPWSTLILLALAGVSCRWRSRYK
ncbi:MAG: hypothetical protein HGA76_02685 [Candidatus Firestonebacteria bacterium]|nr:hypothetical protein [Candidatus Firestonebacteria bacterium]